MKKAITIGVIIIIIIIGFILSRSNSAEFMAGEEQATTTPVVMEGENQLEETATTTEEVVVDTFKPQTVIGSSANGRAIDAYHFGTGDTHVLFVGGIHGGYSWNTALVAYELIDYLKENDDTVPENVSVTVVPVLNPDGLHTVVGTTDKFAMSDVPTDKEDTIPGRFNGNNIDLNRNFDCDWESEGVWQDKTVDGGTQSFSESESKAIKKYIEQTNPEAVVVWYSSAGGVFASNCHNDEVMSETLELTSLYANASGYPAFKNFDFYEVTGDMVNWLANDGIPAISVLLTDHKEIEWDKNKKGVEAVLNSFAEVETEEDDDDNEDNEE